MRQSYFFHDPHLYGMPHYRCPRPPKCRPVMRYVILAALLTAVVLIASVRAQGWKSRTTLPEPAVTTPGPVLDRHLVAARHISPPQT